MIKEKALFVIPLEDRMYHSGLIFLWRARYSKYTQLADLWQQYVHDLIYSTNTFSLYDIAQLLLRADLHGANMRGAWLGWRVILTLSRPNKSTEFAARARDCSPGNFKDF